MIVYHALARRTRMELVADLRRVARLCDRPDGIAPSVHEHEAHGRCHPQTLRARVGGYDARHIPLIRWADAVAILGFVPARKYPRRDPRKGRVYVTYPSTPEPVHPAVQLFRDELAKRRGNTQ